MATTAFKKPGAITLRPVTAEDEPFLLHVFEQTRELEHYAVEWADGEWESFVRGQFEAQRRHYDAVYENAEHSIVVCGGDPVGRIWVWESENELRLLDIALLAEHRRQGIGTRLIRGLQLRATRAGIPLRHMVELNNPDAMRLYERLGFAPAEQQGFHWLVEWCPPESGGKVVEGT